jgi:hypothetical protein
MALDPIAQTSCPIPLRLTAIRADSITVKLRLINASTGRPVVLTGWAGEAKIFATINADVALHSLTVTVDQAAASQPTTGMVTISALPAATILWSTDGFWSLVMTTASVRKTIASGPWQMFGPGMTGPLYVCGLCPLPQVDQAGASCLVTLDGYKELRLPYPQAACAC